MHIYTDGGCIENPGGIGAWAFVAVADGQVLHQASGSELETTNNRTELTAVIEAMEWSLRSGVARPHIFTDSDVTVKCGNGVWKRKSNLDLWDRFLTAKACFPLGVVLQWVRGHNGNEWNEMCDRMCTAEMQKLYGWREARSVREPS